MSVDNNNTSSACSSLSTNTSYDQWKLWADKQRQTARRSFSKSLLEEQSLDGKVQQHMQLPRKQARTSLMNDSDDESDNDQAMPMQMQMQMMQSPQFSWKAMQQATQKATGSSLLDDSDDEDDMFHQQPLRSMPSIGADALFLPPTALRRQGKQSSERFLNCVLGASNQSFNNNSFRNLNTSVPNTATNNNTVNQKIASAIPAPLAAMATSTHTASSYACQSPCRSTASSYSSAAFNSSFSSLSMKSRTYSPKTPNSMCSSGSKSPMPLSHITTMASRRRFTLARNGSMPVV